VALQAGKFTGKNNLAAMKSTTDFTFRALLQNYYAIYCESMGDSQDAGYPTLYDVLSSLATALYAHALSADLEFSAVAD